MQNEQGTYDRYARQLILPGFGKKAQDKLRQTHALVVGAGGLGCPALQYLVAAGIGTLTIADHDVVSLSNLHRQILFTEQDLGRAKASAARERLQPMNAAVCLHEQVVRWGVDECLQQLPTVDIVIDCSDNFETRYLLDDACRLVGLPLVFGAVSRFEGQVALFAPGYGHYRDVFPHPPADGEVMNCAEAGVVGMLPGIIGTMQALEALKWITGIGESLAGKLLTYDALQQRTYTALLHPSDTPHVPGSLEEFSSWSYQRSCVVSMDERDRLSDEFMIVDVRGFEEQPRLSIPHRSIPLPELPAFLDALKGQEIIFVCQSGQRSRKAVQWMKQFDPDSRVFSLKGGVDGIGEK